MAIETTEFANVDISVSPSGVSSGNFGILGFLTNEEGVITPAERSRAYKGLNSVGEDWDITTEVYKAATAFYGQTPTPTDFKVLMCYENAQPAILLGGGSDTVQELIAVTNGSLTISFDGSEEVLTAIDLSTGTDYDSIAAILNAAVVGGNITHNGLQFVATSNTSGAGSAVSFGTEDLATPLGLSQHLGKISDGLDPETPVGALAAALEKGIYWVGQEHHKKYRDVMTGPVGTTSLEIGQWCEAAKRINMNDTNNLATLSAAIDTDIGSVLKSASLRFSLTNFSKDQSLYPGASVFGRAASVNFDGIDTTITLNLKQCPGITAEDLSPGEFAALTDKHVSAVVKIGSGTGDSVNAYTNSRMASGSWLDTTHGLMWLENRIEVDLFNLLYIEPTKIPYTQEGLNLAEARLYKSLTSAVRNGLAAPGYLPDGTYCPEGFIINKVPLGDVPPSDKGDRVYRGLSFQMVGAGALHNLVVNGTFSE